MLIVVGGATLAMRIQQVCSVFSFSCSSENFMSAQARKQLFWDRGLEFFLVVVVDVNGLFDDGWLLKSLMPPWSLADYFSELVQCSA